MSPAASSKFSHRPACDRTWRCCWSRWVNVLSQPSGSPKMPADHQQEFLNALGALNQVSQSVSAKPSTFYSFGRCWSPPTMPAQLVEDAASGMFHYNLLCGKKEVTCKRRAGRKGNIT